MSTKNFNLKEFSSKGGLTTVLRHGKEHFSEAGKKGVEGKRKKYGDEYYQNLAKKGLEARLEKARKRKEKAEKKLKNSLKTDY